MIEENYHTHTTRCKHAVGTEREYIESAIKKGYKVLGFSDHVPQPYPDGFVSGIRMDMGQMDEYIETLLALKEEYADRIRLLIGFEAEYFPRYFDKLMSEIDRRKDIDYLILGQHNVGDEIEGVYSGAPTSDVKILENYVNQCITGLETGRFFYIAHPDIIWFTGEKAAYDYEMSRLIEYSVDKNIPLEINMLGYVTGRTYPEERFFKMAAKAGAPVVLGIDAHRPEQIIQPEEAEGLTDFIDRCGVAIQQRTLS